MLQVTNIRVRSFNLDYLDVFWDVKDTVEDAADYEFVVQRGPAQAGSFVDISAPIIDRYHFRDVTVVGKHSFYHQLYYRIRCTRRDGSETITFPDTGLGVSVGAPADLIALEMAKQEQVKLQEFKGRRVFWYPRRRFGTRCIACYDPVQKRRIRSFCKVCFNTGFAGGYNTPVDFWMQIHTPRQSVMKAESGDIQSEQTSFLAGNYPVLHEGDLIIEAENIRWVVQEGIELVSKGRAVIRQQGQLHRLLPDDVAYTVPVNLTTDEVGSLLTSPERNFTNPQNLESISVTDSLHRIYGPKNR